MFVEGLELEAGVGGRCSRDDVRCARLRRCAESLSAVLNAQSPSPAMLNEPRRTSEQQRSENEVDH